MPIVLRNRPVCHYCGKRNKPVQSQKFRCQHCLADNFLDENGEITDVPIEIAAAPKQYAYPIQSVSSDSIFCVICLKNQAFYTTALSEFLPDPDDPEYEKFENALPEFKRRMEQQYPQCCPRCEPKVRTQLQQATYNARADHLRRVLQKSRARRFANRLGWRSLFVFAAGMGSFSSLVVQLLWHALGSQSTPRAEAIPQSMRCWNVWPVPLQCVEMVEQYVWISLFLGLICVWWNPKWQSKLQGRAERLTGLSAYYRFQAPVLLLRFSAWVLINDVPALAVHKQKLHSVFLVLITLLSAYGFSLVKVDNSPLVDWQQETTPLLTQGQFDNSLISPPPSQETFSMNNLSTNEGDRVAAWRPPTPPINEEDAMDWDPSPVTFTPQPKKMNYKSTQSTPFHGVLPQLPRGSVFNKAQLIEQAKPIGIPMGFFDKPTSESKRKIEEIAPLAQPKFFPNTDRADTGLESIFGKVFSLHDDALEVRPTVTENPSSKSIFEMPTLASQPHTQQLSLYRVFSAVCSLVLTMLTVHASVSYLQQSTLLNRTTETLCIMIAISAINVVTSLTQEAARSKTALHLVTCGGVAGLLFGQPHSESLLLPLWNKLYIGSLCTLLIQAIFDFCVEDASEPATQPLQIENPPVPAMNQPNQSAMRRASVSSVATDSSIATTSTASGWKTPIMNHRLDLADAARPPTGSNTFGIGSLGISDFTVGSSVAGPRNRRNLRH